jgi:hypothetical protein
MAIADGFARAVPEPGEIQVVECDEWDGLRPAGAMQALVNPVPLFRAAALAAFVACLLAGVVAFARPDWTDAVVYLSLAGGIGLWGVDSGRRDWLLWLRWGLIGLALAIMAVVVLGQMRP